MSRKDLFVLLKESGLPVVYRTWAPANPPPLPYVVFRYLNNDGTMKADNRNYYKVGKWYVELYADSKDDEAERALEDVFDAHELAYSKLEAHDLEGVFPVSYLIKAPE